MFGGRFFHEALKSRARPADIEDVTPSPAPYCDPVGNKRRPWVMTERHGALVTHHRFATEAEALAFDPATAPTVDPTVDYAAQTAERIYARVAERSAA